VRRSGRVLARRHLGGGRAGHSTLERYEWEATHLLLPAFEHFSVREITVGRVERWLAQQRAFRYARATHSKKILSLVMGVAVRLEAIDRNPVESTRRIKRPPRIPMAIVDVELNVIPTAVATWRRGAAQTGPKPDGQLEAIIEATHLSAGQSQVCPGGPDREHCFVHGRRTPEAP